MTRLKQINRSATVAYSPSGSYLALGTVAAAVDLSFSTSSTLEVVKLDLSTPNSTLAPYGSPVGASERFNRIAWGSTGIETGDQPDGIIAGGLEDGSICLWDPSKIFEGAGSAAQMAKLQKHTGSVKGLMFNTFSPNLLASGAADGELCIWDLADPTQPSLYPSLKAGNNQSNGEITHLAWNNKVQHILASTAADGSTVVWDLKRQRPVIRFADPQSRRRCSALQWNPEVATQLVVASDDDRSPTLQLWDLRNSVSPLKELAGHSKGVLSMAWYLTEPSLMLTSGKDNRTICWDMDSSSIVTELPPSGNWNFDVAWSPSVPGIFTTASFDGKVTVHNLLQCTGSGMTDVVNEDFSVSQVPIGPAKPLAKAPKWIARPVGATFGFGGRLVSFTNGQKVDASGSAVPCGMINVRRVVSDASLVSRSETFKQSIADGEKGALRDYCASSMDTVKEETERETWAFLRVHFEDDGRRQLLNLLGFDTTPAEVSNLAAAVDDVGMKQEEEPSGAPSGQPKPHLDGSSFFEQLPDQSQGDGDFFENLPTPPASPTAKAAAEAKEELPVPPQGGAEDGEGEILSALYIGDYESAVSTCMKHGRMADALVLASIRGMELLKATQMEYMRRVPKPFMTVVEAVTENNLAKLVRTRPLSSWRETMALLCTYVRSDEFSGLCNSLAARLAQSGNEHAATLCYVCAGNVDEAVKQWSKACKDSKVTVDMMQSIIEKAVVLGMARGQHTSSPVLGELVTQYASLLAAEGRMGTALHYLDLVPGEACTAIAVLKHRIYSSGSADIPPTAAIPPYPYEGYDVQQGSAQPASAASAANGAYSYQQYRAAGGQAQYQAQYQAQPQYAMQPQPQPQPQQQQQYSYGYTQPAASFAAQAPQPAAQAQYAQPAPTAGYTQANQGVGAASVRAPNPHAATGYQPAAVANDSVASVPQPVMFMPQQPAPPSQGAAAPAVPQPSVFTPQPPSSSPQPAVAQTTAFVPQAPSSQRGASAVPGPAPAQAPAKPAPPPTPAGPPANTNMQTVDISGTPAELKPVADTLGKLFHHCASIAPAAKKREMDDNSKRLGVLLWHLNKGDVSSNVAGKLKSLCQSLDAGDLATASHIQVQMTTSDWDECSQWLTALKRLIKTAQTGR